MSCLFVCLFVFFCFQISKANMFPVSAMGFSDLLRQGAAQLRALSMHHWPPIFGMPAMVRTHFRAFANNDRTSSRDMKTETTTNGNKNTDLAMLQSVAICCNLLQSVLLLKLWTTCYATRRGGLKGIGPPGIHAPDKRYERVTNWKRLWTWMTSNYLRILNEY